MSQTTPKKKKSWIKRIFKWTGITLLVLIILVIIAPFIFKDKLVQLVKDEANKQLNAKVDFGDFDLTLISSFPDFKFMIQNVSVVGVGEFEKDTLASIKELTTSINLASVIKGDQYKVNSLIIDHPRIAAIVLPNGKANWDITKPSTDTTAAAPDTAAPTKFALKLKELKIKDGYIVYNDMQGNMSAKLEGFNYDMSGDFTQDIFDMKNLIDVEQLSFDMGGVGYLTKVKTHAKADLAMDMPNMKFTFKENEFSLNDLTLGLDGYVAMPKSDIDMDLKFSAKQTEFKSILSLIPSVYTKDFASVQTAGKLALSGFAKGTYNDKQMPAFGLDLQIMNAMFKYPSLPKSVNNINVDVKVNNPNGVLDATTVDVNKFHLEMAGNPVDMWAHVRTPISDPDLKAQIKGMINLASVKEFVPMEKGDDLNGVVKADIALDGRMSSIDKKEYDKFKAQGSLEIDKMNYKTSALPYEVLLNSMKLNFTNQFVELAGFDAKMGKSDIVANGKIDNFIQYIFKDSLIKGTFALKSNLIDLNELMASSTSTTAVATPTTAAVADTTPMSVIEVPGNIDFVMNANIGKVLYDKLTLDNMAGNIQVRDKKVDMTNLKMNTLGGAMMVNGYYETTNPKKPTVKFNLKVDNFDIQQTFAAFNTIQKLAPIGKYAKGAFTASLENFDAILNDKMEPDMNTLAGHGVLKTNKVNIGGFEPFVKLGDALKIDKLKNMDLQNLDLSYEFKNGRVTTEPFKVKLDQVNATVNGSTGFDQTIDYKWNMEIPRSMFGTGANTALNNLLAQANAKAGTNVSMGDKLNIIALIGGTVMKPTVKTDLKDQAKQATEAVKEQLISTAKDKANEEAQKILDDAQKEADRIKAEAKTAADKLKAEGYAAADKLVADAKNPIAKLAAQKGAEKAKQEVDKKVQKLLDDASAKADKTIADAKVKADQAAGK